MKREKLRIFKDQNRVVWVDKEFTRKQSLDYPRPAWVVEHPKTVIIFLLVSFTVCMTAFFLRPIRIPAMTLLFAAYSTLMVEGFRAKLRADHLSRECFRRGETFDLRNIKLFQTLLVMSRLFFPLYMGIFFLLFLALLYIELYGPENKINFISSALLLFGMPHLCFGFLDGKSASYPYIFMDISEGMLFGGALFSYDTLRDIRSAKRENHYELFYEGEKTADFMMMPDDMSYLREVLALRGKYGEYLDNSP